MFMDGSTLFQEMTGYPPFPWQERLLRSFINNEIPSYINIPTGCGKTKIMHIWLLALAHQATTGKVSIPRRLVWIVNRRTVVDQATEEAEDIVQKLSRPQLREVRDALLSISLGELEEPVAVSTLRGELADNEKWKDDPSRPAIVVGTVDMIGSKLLFRGYGDGRWHRPYHAGLLGTDALIVVDETHLVPAFERLLNHIKKFHDQFPTLRPFHVVFLSATLRKRDAGKVTFTWTPEDEKNEDFKRRVQAKKSLRLHEAENVNDEIVELATSYEGKGAKVAVFVSLPDDAQKIARGIKKRIMEDRVLLLTGEIRGYERDKLTKENELFKKFKFKPQLDKINETLYFVSTSAGEVGIDLDADHCICDLAPIDSLIQRWGRVNRGGLGSAFIDLVIGEIKENDPLKEAKEKTLLCVRNMAEVGPSFLSKVQIPAEAFSPEPFSPQLTPSELHRWSLTSLSFPDIDPNGELKVDSWLHGQEQEPETYFVWREDIKYLASEELKEDVQEILTEFYPPLAKEKLRVPTRKAEKFFRSKFFDDFLDRKIVVLKSDEKIEIVSVKEIREMERARFDLNFATVFLPLEIGGLNEYGYLDEQKIGKKIENLDVADIVAKEGPKRCRLYAKLEDGAWILKSLGNFPLSFSSQILEQGVLGHFLEEIEDIEDTLKKYGFTKRVDIKKDANEEVIECLFYLRKRPDPSFQGSRTPVDLRDHQREVEKVSRKLAEKVGLDKQFCDAIQMAARYHDEGKIHKLWQKVILNNPDPDRVAWAKAPAAKREGRKIGYRHELGSFLLLRGRLKDDLALHLIAASHGLARPIFDLRAFQHAFESEMYGSSDLFLKSTEKVIEECSIRFGRLQRELGWWNLAFLEAILKAADRHVSKREAEGND
jgi:CRISPR-associated endonuclease/helicase Cas3